MKIDPPDLNRLRKIAGNLMKRHNIPAIISVDDLAQSGAEAYLKHIPRYRDDMKSKPGTFLYSKACFAMKDELRAKGIVFTRTKSKSIHNHRNMSELEDAGIELKAEGLTIDGHDAIEVQNRVQQLPFKLMLIVIFYYWLNLPYKKIGMMFGLTESRVSQLMKETMEKLQKPAKKLPEPLLPEPKTQKANLLHIEGNIKFLSNCFKIRLEINKN
ncbi:MAG TPA: sigma-70 family RNA polymerase sigma factor [Clostridia bacterium]|nr:sigma-70 family RNA polymerase sigma factor [Clostridia bacterium]